LGYPDTSGLPEIDFHITDHHAETEGGTLYTEKPLFMPNSFLCFGMRPTCERRTESPASKGMGITFGSFSNAHKLNPQTIAAWCKILHEVPNSRIALKCRWSSDVIRKNIVNEFSKHHIDEERILFLASTKTYDEHVAQYNQIDIALDTYPYSGTTTTCEALWMGVPVVTYVGKSHASRVSNSILKNIGFEETLCYSWYEYVTKAVQLANNPA
ncbi:MAG: hypothetical protein Q9M08_03970, partial [Mariprofundus sp.]|nr:hypothetical protein [Mariprofundus sp.]